jgi:DNA-binding MarR family transcriptional regulator
MQLEESIGYWLSSAQRCFASAFSEVLRAHCVEHGKPYVITGAQWGVIEVLSSHDGQTISTLAQRLGVDGPAVTNIVKRLEQSGLVTRERSHEDERVVDVSLTAEGQDLFRSLDPVVVQFQEEIGSGDQGQLLIEHLQKFIVQVSTVGLVGDRFNFMRDLILQKGNEQKDSFLKEDL